MVAQRVGIMNDNDCSGGEQETDGKGAHAPADSLKDSAKPALLIAALLLTFGALALAAIGIAVAAFSSQPKRGASSPSASASLPPAAVAAVTLAAAEGSSGSVRALAADQWLRWQISEEGDVWRAQAFHTATGRPLSMREAVAGLRDGRLGSALTDVLRRSPHAKSAFFWELPPTTFDAAGHVLFEMVTMRAPGLAGTIADLEPFRRHLESPGACSSRAAGATTFTNLGGDARLIAPCPASSVPADTYASIAPFLRGAPSAQLERFWTAVGTAVESTLQERGGRPTWISTEGSGVAWLHVRLDSSPKYFHYAPFASAMASARDRRTADEEA